MSYPFEWVWMVIAWAGAFALFGLLLWFALTTLADAWETLVRMLSAKKVQRELDAIRRDLTERIDRHQKRRLTDG